MRIAVAGAGHGGLVAAAKLAKSGCNVTVYEKKPKDELGHDWEDRFTFELLLDAVDKKDLPDDIWRYRGDCAFISPAYRTSVVINYTQETRQKIMWRKPIINMLIEYAEQCGVKFEYECEITAPMYSGNRVTGLKTNGKDIPADLVIDSAGIFSPVRSNLPREFCINKDIARGDVFYAYRAYFSKNDDVEVDEIPFEVYLCHAGEQGLSWCCTNDNSVDILIGRIDPPEQSLIDNHIADFKKRHKWIGDDILHGGAYGVIPVRRPLPLMICDGYAAVGDSAFMTTPMNGMGIDLSLLGGKLLADTIISNDYSTSAEALWKYNRDFHKLYGGDTAKNEGLKNTLLQMPQEGIDFLFDNAIIQASDLAGAGSNMTFGILLGKFIRGMRNPKYFFMLLGGLIKGGKSSKLYKNAPDEFDIIKIADWQNKIEKSVVKVTRR